MKRAEQKFQERAERINNLLEEATIGLEEVRQNIKVFCITRRLNNNTMIAISKGTGNLELL